MKVHCKIKTTNIWNSLIIISFIILLAANIFTPFTGDVLVSFGAAIQADHLGEFPLNVYKSWNLRGIGYKYIIYGLHKINDIFQIQNYRILQPLIKFIYYLLFYAITYLSLLQIKGKIRDYGINFSKLFFTFIIAILASSHWMHLQAEEIAVFFSISHFCFSLSNKKIINYSSGIFIPLLLSCKLITVFYAVYPLILLVYLKDKKLLKRFIISSIIFSIGTLLFYLCVIPKEIEDTINSILFQNLNNFYFFHKIKSMIWGLKIAISHSPVILTGIISFSMLIYYFFKKNDVYNFDFIIILFITSFIPIIVQVHFAYHYFAFLPASIIFIIITDFIYSRKWDKIWEALILFTFLAWLLVCIIKVDITGKDVFANVFYYNKKHYEYREKVYTEIDEKYDLSNEKDVLFLCDGGVNYFIKSKSYSRYFIPLPLQRVKNNQNLKTSGIYKTELSNILNYKGNYIIHQFRWMELSNIQSLGLKMQNEYQEVYVNNNNNFIAASIKVLKRK